MNWVFSRRWAETQQIRLSCAGRLTLIGHEAAEVAASIAPEDSYPEGDVLLEFAEHAIVALPPKIGPVIVEKCADELQARGLQCFLDVRKAAADARIVGHRGGLSVGMVGGVLTVTGCEGGVEINEIGGECSLRGVNGGVHLHDCTGDCRVVGLNGGLQVESAGGLTIKGMSGGLMAENVEGSLSLMGHSGGVQAQSVGGGVSVKGMSGGLQLEDVGGDVTLVGSSGGVSLGNIAGDVQMRGVSGGFRAEEIVGDLTLVGHSGSAEARQVCGDLTVRKGSGSLAFDRVEGQAELSEVGSDQIRVTAVGDISAEGECTGQGRWELASETGSVTVLLPQGTQPRLSQAEAGRELRCELDTREDGEPELVLSAAGDIRVAASPRARRRGRPEDSGWPREVRIPMPDVDGIIRDVMEPIFGEKRPAAEDLREERLMILKMVETGKVSAEEGAKLLEALG